MSGGIPHELDLSGLEDKWSTESPDYPDCAVCGERIGDPDHECEDEDVCPNEGAHALPLRLWKDEGGDVRTYPGGGVVREIAFHGECFHGRMRTKGEPMKKEWEIDGIKVTVGDCCCRAQPSDDDVRNAVEKWQRDGQDKCASCKGAFTVDTMSVDHRSPVEDGAPYVWRVSGWSGPVAVAFRCSFAAVDLRFHKECLRKLFPDWPGNDAIDRAYSPRFL